MVQLRAADVVLVMRTYGARDREAELLPCVREDGGMMLCPLKFARYEFEGGTDCIGAECGFFGGVCGSVDAQWDSNGTCPDAMGQPSNHSKAHSKDAPTLSDFYGILSDESDSRERLEAEILDAGCADEIDYDRIIGWLDRQVAITERKHLELACAFQLESDKRITELQAKVDELTEQLEAAHEKNRALKVRGVELEKENAELQDRVTEMTIRLEAIRDVVDEGLA